MITLNLSFLSKLLFFIFIVVIEYLATTSSEIKPIQDSWDKANHFIAFLTLYVTLSFGYIKLEVVKKVVLLLAFGIQIECVQYFLANRDFSLLDIFADGIGIVLGVIIVKVLCSILDTEVRVY